MLVFLGDVFWKKNTPKVQDGSCSPQKMLFFSKRVSRYLPFGAHFQVEHVKLEECIDLVLVVFFVFLLVSFVSLECRRLKMECSGAGRI